VIALRHRPLTQVSDSFAKALIRPESPARATLWLCAPLGWAAICRVAFQPSAREGGPYQKWSARHSLDARTAGVGVLSAGGEGAP